MKSRSMLTALAISYADRLAAFGMPFLMLQFGGGPDVFVRVEYIISVSVIVATFADGGLRSYILYRFGRERDAATTTLLTARATLVVLAVQLVLFAATLALTQTAWLSGSGHNDLPLGVLRGIALAIIGVATQLLVIHERPLAGILISLCSWLIGGTALLLPAGTAIDLRVLAFFCSTFLVVLAVPVLLWRTTRLRPGRDGVAFAMQALSWGWPILVAAASSIAVAQIARIYGLSTFDTDEATSFAFWMRIFSIVQLSHRAAIVMVSRGIFVSDGTGLSPGILRAYLQMLIPAVALGFFAALAAPWANQWAGLHIPHLRFAVTAMIGLQVTAWCFAALTELDLSRGGRVHLIMVASGVPALGFALFLIFVHAPTMLTVAFAMAAASLGQLLLLLVFRHQGLHGTRAHSAE
ncbi:hypothetical protein [Stakelama pacifica]|uniref:O-antigen/teichoic acid export membrane protein n=1 Tax=Stakelama pacifica TaxID=517720 RepID=A0A4R6FGK6_9SPHN|nr:hypothetical protein [Stakelama pacifica]TDN79555.1 hypothetical protein EV664_11234 [Stakelama pacifica]GGP00288.1 hypothetical protein GCM10011329_35820 [Stakelama pacifica]